MNSHISLIQNIDALLPQTQCGLCGHRDGCLPYAQAISEGEAANKCVPGGQPVADAVALVRVTRALRPRRPQAPAPISIEHLGVAPAHLHVQHDAGSQPHSERTWSCRLT